MNSINPRKCARTPYPSDVAARLQIRKIVRNRARRDVHRRYQEKKCYCGQWHLVVQNNGMA